MRIKNLLNNGILGLRKLFPDCLKCKSVILISQREDSPNEWIDDPLLGGVVLDNAPKCLYNGSVLNVDLVLVLSVQGLALHY